MKRLIIILLLTASTSLAATWKAEGPYFGNVLSITLDPANPDRLWVSTHGGGIWRSVDGGKSWQLSGKKLADRVVSYVMLQPKSNTLWAGVERGALARSKDGGETWEWIKDDLALTPHPLAFDPSNPKAIWMADVNLHKRSVDGGAKWTEFRVSGGDVYTFAVHPKDSKIIWAGGSNGRSGLWRTSDGGASWKQLGTGLPESNQPRRIVIDPSAPDTLYMATRRGGGYKSTDGGGSWTPFGGSFPQDEEIESLTMHPTSPQTIYAGTKKGLMRSTDGGETWRRMGGGLPYYVVRGLAINPSNPDVMWAAASGAGIYKTTDGGKSWTEANSGFAASWIENVWGNATGMILAQASRGLFRTDGKGGWVEILQPISKTEANLHTVVFDPRNPRSVLAGYASSLYRSNDGGFTWTDVDTFFQEPRPAFSGIVLDPKNPKVLFSSDGNPSSDEPPIFKSIDGGVKWKAANRGVPPGTGILAMRGDAAGALIAVGKEGGMWRSTDSAVSWTAAGGGLPSKDLIGMAVDRNVYVAAKEGLFRSEDGGATFTHATKGIEKKEIAAVAVDGKGNVYVGTFDGVFRSTDGGKSWTAFNDGLTNEDVRALHGAGTRLYAGTAGGGVFSIDVE